MVDLNTLSIVLTGIGIIAAIVYYAQELRNQNKTRQIQLFMQIFHQFTSLNYQRDLIELYNMEWKDYDDFEKKYGSDNNPENYAKRQSIWLSMNGIGALLDDRLLEPERLLKSVDFNPVWLWEKYKSIIYEQRIRYKSPTAFQYFEQVATVMKEEILRRDGTFEVPEHFTKYIPDA